MFSEKNKLPGFACQIVAAGELSVPGAVIVGIDDPDHLSSERVESLPA